MFPDFSQHRTRIFLALGFHIFVTVFIVFFLHNSQDSQTIPRMPTSLRFQFQVTHSRSQSTKRSEVSPPPRTLRVPSRTMNSNSISATSLSTGFTSMANPAYTPDLKAGIDTESDPLSHLLMEMPDLPTPDETYEVSSDFTEVSGFELDFYDAGFTVRRPIFPVMELELPAQSLEMDLRLSISAQGILLTLSGVDTGSSQNDRLIIRYFHSLEFPASDRDYEILAKIKIQRVKAQ